MAIIGAKALKPGMSGPQQPVAFTSNAVEFSKGSQRRIDRILKKK